MAPWLARWAGRARNCPPSPPPPPRDRPGASSFPPAGIEAVSRETPADRGPVAPDRIADRLHAAAPAPGRRGPAHARGEGVREGRRRAPGEARTRPAARSAVRRVARARDAPGPRGGALDASNRAPGARAAPGRGPRARA